MAFGTIPRRSTTFTLGAPAALNVGERLELSPPDPTSRPNPGGMVTLCLSFRSERQAETTAGVGLEGTPIRQLQHEVAGGQIVDAFDHALGLICAILVSVEVQIGVTSIMADPDLGTIAREGV